jgi:hypothetical protein
VNPCHHGSQNRNNYAQKRARIGQKTPTFEYFCPGVRGHYSKISTSIKQRSSKTEVTFRLRNYAQKHAKINQKTSSFECSGRVAAGRYPKICTSATRHSSKTEGTFTFRTVIA